MRMRTALATALVAAVLASVASRAQIPAPIVPPVPAQPGMPPAYPYVEDEPGLLVGLLLRGAGLSREQRRKVRYTLAEHRPRLRAAKGQLRAAQDALADRMTVPGPLAAKALEPQVERLAKAHRAQIDEVVATALEVRVVLTPEQLARAAKWKDRFQRLRKEMQELVDEGGEAGGREPAPEGAGERR